MYTSASVSVAVVVCDIFLCSLRESKSHNAKEKLLQPNGLHSYVFAYVSCKLQLSFQTILFLFNTPSSLWLCRVRRFSLLFSLSAVTSILFGEGFYIFWHFTRKCQLLLVVHVCDLSEEMHPARCNIEWEQIILNSPLFICAAEKKNWKKKYGTIASNVIHWMRRVKQKKKEETKRTRERDKSSEMCGECEARRFESSVCSCTLHRSQNNY